MGERGDLWHRAIIDPTVLRVVGPVRGLRVVDLACGNGYLTRRWAQAGAARSVGIERSRPTLAKARERERRRRTGAEFLLRDAARLTGLAGSSFDLVVANMALQDLRDLPGTVREVARVLQRDGRFVFSISHPCFDIDERSGWVVERVREASGRWRNLVWRKVHNYRDERTVEVPWSISKTETGVTLAYHRTLSTYSRVLRASGLAITRLEEPEPLAEALRRSPQGPFLREVPLHLVVEARFLTTAPRGTTRTRHRASPGGPARSRERGARTTRR
jgi:ubiquinone/menaquinone biosynthesis C-methylase UbiE